MQWWVPENYYLGGGATESTISAAALAMCCASIAFTVCLPRKYAGVPFVLGLLLIPTGNVVVLGGLHLMPARILSLCSWIRWLPLTPCTTRVRFNEIDNALAKSILFTAISFVLLWRTSDAMVNRCGYLWSTLGVYVLLRYFIQDEKDAHCLIKGLAFAAVLEALGMLYEQCYVTNPFGVLIGGVRMVPEIREDEIRSQGTFGHSILAGTNGATWIPLFVLLWSTPGGKWTCALGVAASLVMTLTSGSSTPVLALLATGLAFAFWPLRTEMRKVRYAVVGCLLLLQTMMNAPVWFLIERMNITGSSSGYHRAQLVDNFIRRFFEWWLIGTNEAGNWGHANFDASNMYVSTGQGGGVLAFVFFIAVLSRSYGRLGRLRKLGKGRKEWEWRVWCLGCALFGHVTAFFGVSYWDQTEAAWYAFLAILSAYGTSTLDRRGGHLSESVSIRKQKSQLPSNVIRHSAESKNNSYVRSH